MSHCIGMLAPGTQQLPALTSVNKLIAGDRRTTQPLWWNTNCSLQSRNAVAAAAAVGDSEFLLIYIAKEVLEYQLRMSCTWSLIPHVKASRIHSVLKAPVLISICWGSLSDRQKKKRLRLHSKSHTLYFKYTLWPHTITPWTSTLLLVHLQSVSWNLMC